MTGQAHDRNTVVPRRRLPAKARRSTQDRQPQGRQGQLQDEPQPEGPAIVARCRQQCEAMLFSTPPRKIGAMRKARL